MHETRKGEMAALRELPFGQYYGGVDTTPLFVMLAGAYAARTGDLGLVDELWPSLCAAMAWIEGDGDSNGDGFVDYARGAATGLANQGWKDSQDSVFHADGTDAVGPIALIEVQGYVYAALAAMADLAARRGETAERRTMAGAGRAPCARRSRRGSGSRSWATTPWPWTARGAPCRVRGSNAGHLLFTGLPTAGARRAGRGPAPGIAVQLRLGHPHARRRRDALQPDVLPQRLGLAARHRLVRRGPLPLRRRATAWYG